MNILYGSPSGLTSTGNQLWTQNGRLTAQGFTADITEKVEADDHFGAVLTAGNFNGDSRNGHPIDDLVIGVFQEDIPGVGEVSCASDDGEAPLAPRTGLMCPALETVNAGAVVVLYGTNNGITHFNNQFWTQNGRYTEQSGYTDDMQGNAEVEDFFGFALAVGNFNADTRNGLSVDDLAVGVPYEDLDGVVDAGAVHVLHGSSNRLSSTWNQLWRQDRSDVEDQEEYRDRFGWSLAAGDFDGQGGDDLAVGVIGERVRKNHRGTILEEQGAVHLFYWSGDENRLSRETIVCGLRATQESKPRKRRICLDLPLPQATLTAMAVPTWRLAFPRKASGRPTAVAALSMYCTGLPKAWSLRTLRLGLKTARTSKERPKKATGSDTS